MPALELHGQIRMVALSNTKWVIGGGISLPFVDRLFKKAHHREPKTPNFAVWFSTFNFFSSCVAKISWEKAWSGFRRSSTDHLTRTQSCRELNLSTVCSFFIHATPRDLVPPKEGWAISLFEVHSLHFESYDIWQTFRELLYYVYYHFVIGSLILRELFKCRFRLKIWYGIAWIAFIDYSQ
jgi:hypothetical protein